jgi:hypothetical protein
MAGTRGVLVALAAVGLAAAAAYFNPTSDAQRRVPVPPAPVAAPAVAYDRGLYKHWTDVDRDCQDTRQEVLIAESVRPVTLDARRCKVVSGEWHDPYTGRVFTNPADLDIDHMVPLAEAHASGGDAWPTDRRQAYANDLSDPNTLVAVSASANRSKGDKDPAKWMPANVAFRCTYVRVWAEVKLRWSMGMDAAERQAVAGMLHDCDDTPLVASISNAPAPPRPRLREGG